MKKKLTILSSALALGVAASSLSVTASAAKKKDRIDSPKDSATFLSLTYTELFDTLNGDEYYVSIKNVETGEVKTVARRDEDTYVSTVDKKGETSTSFVVDNTLYTLDDEEETITVDILNVPVQDVSVIDYANLKFEMSDTDEAGGTVEQFKAGSSTEYYHFNTNNELVKVVIADKRGNETEYEVVEFGDEVPEDLFSTKNGYDIVSAKYKLADSRVMKIFDELLSGDGYTLAFNSNEYSVTVVKSGYDYYSNIVDSVEKTTTKQLALGSSVYTFNDANKTYTVAERKYDDRVPEFFNTARYELDGIEKVTENKKDYIVETVSDSQGIYKFYWQDSTLVKIETVNASDKVLDTTTFKTFSADADKAALTLPTSYKEEVPEKPDVSVGEGEGDNSLDLENPSSDATTPDDTADQNVGDTAGDTANNETPEDTTPVDTTTTTTTVTTQGSPKTGQTPYALAAIPVAIAAAALLAKKRSK